MYLHDEADARQFINATDTCAMSPTTLLMALGSTSSRVMITKDWFNDGGKFQIW